MQPPLMMMNELVKNGEQEVPAAKVRMRLKICQGEARGLKPTHLTAGIGRALDGAGTVLDFDKCTKEQNVYRV